MIDVADLFLGAGLIMVAIGIYLEPTVPEILVAVGLGTTQLATMLAIRGGPDEGEGAE